MLAHLKTTLDDDAYNDEYYDSGVLMMDLHPIIVDCGLCLRHILMLNLVLLLIFMLKYKLSKSLGPLWLVAFL